MVRWLSTFSKLKSEVLKMVYKSQHNLATQCLSELTFFFVLLINFNLIWPLTVSRTEEVYDHTLNFVVAIFPVNLLSETMHFPPILYFSIDTSSEKFSLTTNTTNSSSSALPYHYPSFIFSQHFFTMWNNICIFFSFSLPTLLSTGM